MKYVDVLSLLEGEPAQLALFATFGFDPDFFERRFLRTPSLAKARRIAVFVDAREWLSLLRSDVLARSLNRRYLVIPVNRRGGVFHPKLSLFVSEHGGQVTCGSNNLTRSGCASNLELLNCVPFVQEADDEDAREVARSAFDFFTRAAQDADEDIARIVADWLDEVRATTPWLIAPRKHARRPRVRLIHTYQGGIWQRLTGELGGARFERAFVISPFFDADGDLLLRIRTEWPRAKIEILVQQNYTELPVAVVEQLGGIELSELKDTSRRLHAKLFAWTTSRGSRSAIVGSANFTSAAFDGRNVETCLLITEAGEFCDALFDRQMPRRALLPGDFVPGVHEAEDNEDEQYKRVVISSAVLSRGGVLRVRYSHNLSPPPTAMRLAIRAFGEPRPRATNPLRVTPKGTETITLSERALLDSHGTLLASVIAEVGSHRIESAPVWVVQEERLTYEPTDGEPSKSAPIEESGEGLAEYLDEIGARDGVAAVIEYLSRLNIRFYDGESRQLGPRTLRLRVRDPFHPDIMPDWLIKTKGEATTLEQAIYNFVDRHDEQRLRRHANRGNINGMENFIDIMTAMIRLLYVYYKRGVVKKAALVGRLCTYIRVASCGDESEHFVLDGYLSSVHRNLGGDLGILREACDETGFVADVRAAVLIVQKVRYVPNEISQFGSNPKRPRDVLRHLSTGVANAISACGLREPKKDEVHAALERYHMFSDKEILEQVAELP